MRRDHCPWLSAEPRAGQRDGGSGAGAVLTADIRTIKQTGSTNADLIALAKQGVAEGFWLRAEQQSGGRGRMARRWESPQGNLYCSTLVRLRPHDPPPGTLALVAVVAVHEAVSLYMPSERVLIKWPNDLLVDGAKLCGILLERADDAIVIGIGLNMAHHPEGLDRPVTSMANSGAGKIDPGYFLETLADIFARWLEVWRVQGLAPIRTQWLKYAHGEGSALKANLPDGTVVEGLFSGIGMDGALILRLANGTSHVIHAGDIFLI
ncbi:MAG: biotin--[acetyl-CoA-carboxylase] ligase [Alphaproteobacteria bacterium]|nr:biotin--[acetyl-CoA-carboxylase] ligase [Alphaproteobacteria bacterium]